LSFVWGAVWNRGQPLPLEALAEAIALPDQGENRATVHQPVEQGGGHLPMPEPFGPACEVQVGGQPHAGPHVQMYLTASTRQRIPLLSCRCSPEPAMLPAPAMPTATTADLGARAADGVRIGDPAPNTRRHQGGCDGATDSGEGAHHALVVPE